jgi:hypothetical protein
LTVQRVDADGFSGGDGTAKTVGGVYQS